MLGNKLLQMRCHCPLVMYIARDLHAIRMFHCPAPASMPTLRNARRMPQCISRLAAHKIRPEVTCMMSPGLATTTCNTVLLKIDNRQTQDSILVQGIRMSLERERARGAGGRGGKGGGGGAKGGRTGVMPWVFSQGKQPWEIGRLRRPDAQLGTLG